MIPSVLMVAGVAVEVVAAIGVTVMRDVFDRLHYVSLAGFGALLVGIAILCAQSFSLIGDKALGTGALLVLVSPVLVHTTARSLRMRSLGDWEEGIEEHREPDE
jgi:multisubunit Na+/H+ antiporter MnhG subunit